MYPVNYQTENSDYNLICNSSSNNKNYLFDNISFNSNKNCDNFDNSCNLLLNPITNYNNLKERMIEFNSYNNTFNIDQKFTNQQMNLIFKDNSSLNFKDIYDISANIPIKIYKSSYDIEPGEISVVNEDTIELIKKIQYNIEGNIKK